jgi:hypothetical protein
VLYHIWTTEQPTQLDATLNLAALILAGLFFYGSLDSALKATGSLTVLKIGF